LFVYNEGVRYPQLLVDKKCRHGIMVVEMEVKMKILTSHVSGIADLMRQRMGFHEAFTEVTGDYFCEFEIDEAKKLIGERLGIRSGIRRRNKMVRQSAIERTSKHRAVSMEEQMKLIDTHPYPG